MSKDQRHFIRLDVHMPDHPKVDGLSDAAFRLLITVWCRCAMLNSDGLITLTWWKKQSPKACHELVAAGLIESTDDGMVAHDYLKHQTSAAERAEVAAKRADAGRQGGKQKAANRLASAVASASAPLEQLASKALPEVEVEEEVEELQTKTPSPAARASAKPILANGLLAAFEAFWEAYPRKIGKLDAQRRYAEAIKRASIEEIQLAAKRYAREAHGSDPRFIAHPATWLNHGRWDDQLPHAVGQRVTAAPVRDW